MKLLFLTLALSLVSIPLHAMDAVVKERSRNLIQEFIRAIDVDNGEEAFALVEQIRDQGLSFDNKYEFPANWRTVKQNTTLLAWAAAHDCSGIIQALLNAGADVNAHDSLALKTAIEAGKFAAISVLIRNGAFTAEELRIYDYNVAELALSAGLRCDIYSTSLRKLVVKYALRSIGDSEFNYLIDELKKTDDLSNLASSVLRYDRATVITDLGLLLTEKAGKIRYIDLISDVTVQDRFDEIAHRTTKIVVYGGDRYRPAISIVNDNDEEIARYLLRPNTCLLVANGQQVSVGEALCVDGRASVEEKSSALEFAAAYRLHDIIPLLLAAGAPTKDAIAVLTSIQLRLNNFEKFNKLDVLYRVQYFRTPEENRQAILRLHAQRKKEYEKIRLQLGLRNSLKETILASTNPSIHFDIAANINRLHQIEQKYENMLIGTRLDGRQPSSVMNRIIPSITVDASIQIQSHRNSALAALATAVKERRQEIVPLISRAALAESQTTLLLPAAQFGDVNAVRRLLDNGISADCQEAQNLSSPLMFAAQKNYFDMANLILNHRTMADKKAELLAKKNRDGRTPLMLACMNGHADLVSLLLDNGAQDDTFDNNGISAFMHASQARDEGALTIMLQHPRFKAQIPEMVKQTNAHGQTPLALAVKNGSRRTVEICLAHGASVFTQDKDGHSPWLHAVKSGHLDIIRLLYDHTRPGIGGRDLYAELTAVNPVTLPMLPPGRYDLVRQENKEGQSALLIACITGKKDVIEFLLGVDEVAELIRSDDHPSSRLRDNKKNSAIMHIVRTKSAEILEMFLKHPLIVDFKIGKILQLEGRNELFVNSENNEGDTALTIACAQNDTDCAKLLIKEGAEALLLDGAGLSPLMHAAYHGNKAILHALLVAHRQPKGAPSAKPSHQALISQQSTAIPGRIFPRQNIINQKANALILASQQGHLEIVETLVDLQADRSVVDAAGRTALSAAREAGKSNVVQYLESKNKRGWLSHYWSSK